MAVERGGDNGRGYPLLPDVAMARPKASRPSASGAGPRIALRASRRNAKQAHALWMPVNPPGSGRNREGTGLRMARGRPASSVLAKSPTRKMKSTGSRARAGASTRKAPSVSPQNLVANAQRAGATSVAGAKPGPGLIPTIQKALTKRSTPQRSSSGSSGLKNYGRSTSGGSIGQAQQSFFDIGNFLRNLGK